MEQKPLLTRKAYRQHQQKKSSKSMFHRRKQNDFSSVSENEPYEEENRQIRSQKGVSGLVRYDQMLNRWMLVLFVWALVLLGIQLWL